MLDTGASKNINIPIYENGLDIIWSGAITGRTKYSNVTKKFQTADCGNDGTGGCMPSQGFMQPATQAELTFAK